MRMPARLCSGPFPRPHPVNVASRMMSTGCEGRIQRSPSAVAAMRLGAGGIDELEDALLGRGLTLAFRGLVKVKGKGDMPTHWLEALGPGGTELTERAADLASPSVVVPVAESAPADLPVAARDVSISRIPPPVAPHRRPVSDAMHEIPLPAQRLASNLSSGRGASAPRSSITRVASFLLARPTLVARATSHRSGDLQQLTEVEEAGSDLSPRNDDEDDARLVDMYVARAAGAAFCALPPAYPQALLRPTFRIGDAASALRADTDSEPPTVLAPPRGVSLEPASTEATPAVAASQDKPADPQHLSVSVGEIRQVAKPDDAVMSSTAGTSAPAGLPGATAASSSSSHVLASPLRIEHQPSSKKSKDLRSPERDGDGITSTHSSTLGGRTSLPPPAATAEAGSTPHTIGERIGGADAQSSAIKYITASLPHGSLFNREADTSEEDNVAATGSTARTSRVPVDADRAGADSGGRTDRGEHRTRPATFLARARQLWNEIVAVPSLPRFDGPIELDVVQYLSREYVRHGRDGRVVRVVQLCRSYLCHFAGHRGPPSHCLLRTRGHCIWRHLVPSRKRPAR